MSTFNTVPTTAANGDTANYIQISSFDIGMNNNVDNNGNYGDIQNTSLLRFQHESQLLLGNKRKKHMLIGMALLAFIVMAVVALKPSSSSQQQQTNEYESISIPPDHNDDQQPPPFNEGLKNLIKNSTPKEVKKLFTTIKKEVTIDILNKYIPDVPNTPEQQQALDWLMTFNIDSAKLRQRDSNGLRDRYGLLQRFVIAVFYFSTNGVEWKTVDEWHMNIHNSVCEWSGIKCDNDKNIIELSKVDDNLRGKIPSELGLLTSMEQIILSYNRLEGNVPTELQNLSQLTRLDLYDNNLTGTLPSELIPKLDSLSDCELGGNLELKGIPSKCV